MTEESLFDIKLLPILFAFICNWLHLEKQTIVVGSVKHLILNRKSNLSKVLDIH